MNNATELREYLEVSRKSKKVWTVISGNAHTYCYTKAEAQNRKRIYQSLGYTKVMIKCRFI